MKICLPFLDRLTYGVHATMGKAAAMVLIVSSSSVMADEPVTILALGDSLTQGYGLPQDEGFVPQLSVWLAQNGEAATIINAGVSGDTTAGGAARVAWSLTPEIDAMIVSLGANDMLRGLDPSAARQNLTTILEVAQDNNLPVLLVGLEAPSNFGPAYKSEFDAMYPELSQMFETVYFESFFKGLGEGDPADLQAFFQTDRIHPNADGVARIVSGMGPAVVELIDRIK